MKMRDILSHLLQSLEDLNLGKHQQNFGKTVLLLKIFSAGMAVQLYVTLCLKYGGHSQEC